MGEKKKKDKRRRQQKQKGMTEEGNNKESTHANQRHLCAMLAMDVYAAASPPSAARATAALGLHSGGLQACPLVHRAATRARVWKVMHGMHEPALCHECRRRRRRLAARAACSQ